MTAGGVVWCVDLGSAVTRAAFAVDGGPPRTVPVDGGELRSVAWLAPDGTLRVGRQAWAEGLLAPERLMPAPSAALGTGPEPDVDGVLDVVHDGGIRALSAPAVTAELLRCAVQALRTTAGGRPDRMVLTHPPSWDPIHCDALRRAAALAGLPPVDLVPAPVAALRTVPAPAGDRVSLVVDLGATGDIAVVAGPDVLAGAGGVPGGAAFDAVLARQVCGALARTDPGPAARFAAADVPAAADGAWDPFRRALSLAVTAARERLSTVASTPVVVAWPDVTGPGERTVAADRAAFAHDIAAMFEDLVPACASAVRRAGVPVDAVVLTGGAAPTPGVAEALRAFGPVLTPAGSPATAVVRGGALTPAGLAAGSGRPIPAAGPGWVRTMRLPGAVREVVLPRPTTAVVTAGRSTPTWCALDGSGPATYQGRRSGPGPARLLSLSPDRRTVAAVNGSDIHLWQALGEYAGPLAGTAAGEPTAVVAAGDGGGFVVREPGFLERWTAGRRSWRRPVHPRSAVLLTPGGGVLVAGPAGVSVTDAAGDPVRVVDRREATASAAAAGCVVVAYGDDLVLYDAAGPALTARWSRRTAHPVVRAAVGPHGGAVLVATAAGVLVAWTGAGAPLPVPARPAPVTGVAVAPDNGLLVAGYADGILCWFPPG